MQRHRGKYWFGTLNNPGCTPEALWSKITLCGGTWLKGQPEKGAEGTRHFQFVCSFATEKRINALKKIDPRVHWELTRSEAAEAYVHKEDTRDGEPFEFGTKSSRGDN